MYEHKFDEARQLIESANDIAARNNQLPSNPFADGLFFEILGIIERAQKHFDKAQTNFQRGRDQFSEWLKNRPGEPMALAYLAVALPARVIKTRHCRRVATR